MALTIQVPNFPVPNFPDPKAADPWQELDERRHKQILDLRDRYADFAIGIAQAWVVLLFVVTLIQLSKSKIGLGLSENEFITILGGSMASILGYAYIVGKFLFPKDGSTHEWKKHQ